MSVCAACHLEIADRFILRVHPNLEFHASCLKCSECCRPLDESCTAFVRNGVTYCREDYFRLVSNRSRFCSLMMNLLLTHSPISLMSSNCYLYHV
ncbi:LIM domain protein [Ancylostoma caninum]|uniref:LIM domain protein n=1 Tax=Ancylostoma caninum TaxID=29170 RepID=A0A368FPL6_ANCCA|nr:LIM domain protein [Ancylostoma caninum]